MDDLKGLLTENLNVRYLAWRVDNDPGKWSAVLRRKASIPETRAMAILNRASLTREERAACIEGFNVNIEDFSTGKLFGLSGIELARENIKYLVGRLPHGEGKRMAQALNVTQETVTRWKRTGVTNNFRPSKILQYMGLDTGIDLNNVPLFLSLNPVGKFAIKRWLIDRLNNISSNELTRLYPALKKLLSHHEGD